MSESAGEKTEAPTPRRKKKAVEDGQLLKSRDFGAALVVLVGCGWIALLGPSLMQAFQGIMVACLSFGRGDVEHFGPLRPIGAAAWLFAMPIGGLLLLAFAGAIASQAAMGHLGWNNKVLAPKGNRMDPVKGLGRLFGPNGWIELGKSLLKVVLLGCVGGWMLWSLTGPAIGLTATDVRSAIGMLGDRFVGLVFVMAGGLVLIAGVDLPIQIIRHLGKLRMSKQEIKDEHKQTEGSPEAKAAQRQRQRQMARGSMRKSVATAHVVLTNPTHFAVALRYDRDNDTVPVVVARGRGQTALAIRELAAEFRVPVLEYPSLARAIYYTSRDGQEIRDDLYVAIATVLAFVFGVNARAGGRPPEVEAPASARFDENGVQLGRRR